MSYGYTDMGVAESFAELGMGVLLGVFVIMMLFALALSAAVYVLQSLSFYTIAKRRGIHNPWLSWIPVGNMWILGSIADQYQYVAKGKVRSRRKVLMGMTIAMYVLSIPSFATQVFTVVQSVTGYNTDVTAAAGLMVVCSLVLAVLSIVATVFQYIAYYDLFTSCQPSNSVMYLVLSILFSITLPIFLFVCRKKDEGMPPRKKPTAPQLVEEPEVVHTEVPAEDDDAVTEADFVTEEEIKNPDE